MISMEKLEELLEEACFGNFTCDDCGSSLEPDAKKCGLCGWINPLRNLGFI